MRGAATILPEDLPAGVLGRTAVLIGTIGGGRVEFEAIQRARGYLAAGTLVDETQRYALLLSNRVHAGFQIWFLRTRVLRRMMSFLMAATRATFGRLPLSRSLRWKALMVGLNRTALSAAM